MDTITVESNKKYKAGFVLSEPELRRLVDTIAEQLRKIDSSKDVLHKYAIKFRNGAIAETHNIDEVLKEENTGSCQVIRLRTESVLENDDSGSIIITEFINIADDEETGTVPIKQSISGSSRDWVFVTSSLLEERISKVKRNQAPRVLKELGFPIGLFLTMFLLVYIFPSKSAKTTKSIDRIETLWKHGQLNDPVEALIMLERARETQGSSGWHILKLIAAVIVVSISLYGIGRLISKYYPLYNFCWGDYLEEFKKVESRRTFMLVVIILGLAISAVGSIIANALGAVKIF